MSTNRSTHKEDVVQIYSELLLAIKKKNEIKSLTAT